MRVKIPLIACALALTTIACAAKSVKDAKPTPKKTLKSTAPMPFYVPGIGSIFPEQASSSPLIGNIAVPTNLNPLPVAPGMNQVNGGNPSVSLAPASTTPTLTLNRGLADILLPKGVGAPAEAVAQFMATVANPTMKELRVGLVGGKTSELIHLGPMKSLTLPVMAPPPSKSPGIYPLQIHLMLNNRIISNSAVQVCVPLYCKKAKLPVRVNGMLNEWDSASSLNLNPAMGSVPKITARTLMEWNGNYLYLAITETDSKLSAGFLPENVLQGDNVEFAVDPYRDNIKKEETVTVYHFAMAKGLLHGFLYQFGNGGAGKVADSAKVAVRRVDDRTIYEAEIPWSLMPGIKPTPGASFGFSLRVNDPDGNPPGALEWGEGIQPLLDPTQFYCVELTP